MRFGEIRDMLMPMLEDAAWAEDALDRDDNQFTRRTYIRSLFAMIEGTLWVFKKVILDAPVQGGNVKRLSLAEYTLLSEKTYELKNNGEPKEQNKHLELTGNFKFTFNMLSKYFKTEIPLGIGSASWNNFLLAKKIRNRITHPKKTTDFEISDDEISKCKDVCSWFNKIVVAFFDGVISNANNNNLKTGV